MFACRRWIWLALNVPKRILLAVLAIYYPDRGIKRLWIALCVLWFLVFYGLHFAVRCGYGPTMRADWQTFLQFQYILSGLAGPASTYLPVHVNGWTLLSCSFVLQWIAVILLGLVAIRSPRRAAQKRTLNVG